MESKAIRTQADFETVVGKVLDALPPWVHEAIDNLVVVVEDEPSSEQDPTNVGLLGLYSGVSLIDRAGSYWGVMPDQITIFRLPHLQLALADEELEAEIRRTLLHELAHHMGIDDRRLVELDWD